MRLVRFQQKPSENQIGVMIDSSRFAELSASKSFEPILDFLQDPKSEAKANQTVKAAKKQIADSEKSPKGVGRIGTKKHSLSTLKIVQVTERSQFRRSLRSNSRDKEDLLDLDFDSKDAPE